MATETTGFFAILGKIADAVCAFFTYLNCNAERKEKKLKEKKQKICEKNKRLDTICDKGNIRDLIEEMENK